MADLIFYALAGLLGSWAGTRLFIALMRSAGAGQPIRDYGPKIHEHKRGTPTMGGAVLLIVFLAVLILYQITVGPLSADGLLLAAAALGFGLIGLWDDALKFLQQHSRGLPGRYKLLLQLVISAALLYGLRASGEGPPALAVPFTSPAWEPDRLLYDALVLLVFLGTVNAWNLTDGLDGLAAGVTLIVLAAYGVIVYQVGAHSGLFEPLVIFGGVLLGFLWFNVHPARIFLGDTGSMALGGFVAALSVLSGTVFFLLLFAIVPLLEALSVMIQVFSFKVFGRRVFKVSPLHHHFERAEGIDYPYLLPNIELPEWVITLMFWLITVLFTALGIWGLFG
jgi:phospho-N-acetylmuramoyl-pentapeptide-transferase